MPRPGIIGGAAQGVGRGRQVIAVARSADVVLMMLDATRPDAHRAALEGELAACGIRLNQVLYASGRKPNTREGVVQIQDTTFEPALHKHAGRN